MPRYHCYISFKLFIIIYWVIYLRKCETFVTWVKNTTERVFVLLQGTFHYSSSYWTDRNEYNPPGGETGFDEQETKLAIYWNASFSKICLGMKINEQLRFIVINEQLTLCTHWSPMGNTAKPHCVVIRGKRLLVHLLLCKTNVTSKGSMHFVR